MTEDKLDVEVEAGTPAKDVEMSMSDKLKELFRDFPDAPSTSEVDKLKATHGDVFLSALNEDELFLFRALSRKEHRESQMALAENKIQPDEMELKIVQTCLLWKSIPDLEVKAGTIPSLFEQVMQNSNFIAPQLLSNLVTKL